MAVSPIIPQSIQVRLLWNIGGQLAINVLHSIVQPAVVVNQTYTNTLGAAIKAAYTAQLAAQQPATTQLTKIGVRDRRAANTAEFLDAGAPALGSAPGEGLPPQIALCITLRTLLAGKSFRGRVYLPGFAESVNGVNGVMSQAASDAGVAFIGAVDTAMQNSQGGLGVASREAEAFNIVKTTFHSDGTETVETIRRGSARGASVQDVNIVQSRNLVWETQRRRMNSRGAVPVALALGSLMELER